MQLKCKKIIQIVLLLIIISTLAFIFIRSTKSPAESAKESNKIGEIIEEIIPPETPTGGYIQKNIRKLAHFTEFFVLGAETAVYVFFFLPKMKFAFMSCAFGLICGAVDECIQIFTGRGPAIKDVLIDFSGFFAGLFIIYTVCLLIRLIVRKCKQK